MAPIIFKIEAKKIFCWARNYFLGGYKYNFWGQKMIAFGGKYLDGKINSKGGHFGFIWGADFIYLLMVFAKLSYLSTE